LASKTNFALSTTATTQGVLHLLLLHKSLQARHHVLSTSARYSVGLPLPLLKDSHFRPPTSTLQVVSTYCVFSHRVAFLFHQATQTKVIPELEKGKSRLLIPSCHERTKKKERDSHKELTI